MSRNAIVLGVLLATAMTCATLGIVFLTWGPLVLWGQTLPSGHARLIESGLLLLSALLTGVAAFFKLRREINRT